MVPKLEFVSLFLGAFYQLVATANSCTVVSSMNDTAEIFCRYHEVLMKLPNGDSQRCLSQRVAWQRTGYHLKNLTDDAKYTIWQTVPELETADGQRISMLRIRHFQPEDMGLYQCRVQCVSDDGRVYVNQRLTDLCLEHGPDYPTCAARALGNKCAWVFGNGRCDSECDNEENLYDGFDCSSAIPECPRRISETCRRDFANGACDPECDSDACAWDGGDCIDKPLVFASDKLVIYLATWYKGSVNIKDFARVLSELLRTVVRAMPGELSGTEASGSDAWWHRPDRRRYEAMRTMYVKIDNTQCSSKCLPSAEAAAKFINLAQQSGWDPGLPISNIGVLSKTVSVCESENTTRHIELPLPTHGSSDPSTYSYSHAGTAHSSLPPAWLLAIAAIGAVIIIVLFVLILNITLRIRELYKEERHQAMGGVNERHSKRVVLNGAYL